MKSMQKDIKTDNKNKSGDLHPCQNCNKQCFGLQCKECHLKMVEEKKANMTKCTDCDKSFNSKKLDGSKNTRCFECRKSWYKKNFKACPGCKENYRYLLDTGKTIDMCRGCYRSTMFHKCSTCDNTTHIKTTMCSWCYGERRMSI